jgi:hypothetical protein
MKEMKDEGFINATWDKHLDQTTGNNECAAADISTEGESSSQLTMKHMGGIFVFHTILTSAALIMAIAAWFWERRTGQAVKKEKRRPPQTQSLEPTSTALPESDSPALWKGHSVRFNIPDDSSDASELSDVEMEHMRKLIRSLSTVQKQDMITVEDRLIANEERLIAMTAILQRIEGQKNESDTNLKI